MMKGVISLWKEKKRTILFFGIIFAGAIFLRAYHFHDWLHFGSDQVRDLVLIEGVTEYGNPWPLLGADASNTHFKLGPVYHYFQIIAVMIFGNDPSVMAYPDFFFSVLSIPLAYILFRRYFSEHLALPLVALYGTSFYVVEYSRFAWNPNPIPFFVALYLLAALEFLEKKNRTPWPWTIVLGSALGIGIQLHTLLLLLLPTIFFLLAIFLLRQNWRMTKQIIMIVLVAFLWNIAQIRSELHSRGSNTQKFLAAFTDRSDNGGARVVTDFGENILNHAQANAHILSSLGEKGHFTFSNFLSHPEKVGGASRYRWFLLSVIMSILFSVAGYGLLVYRAWNEPDKKRKQFLILISIFVGLSFLILLPVARGAPIRYFIHTIFIPFILFGLLVEWMSERASKRWLIAISMSFIFLFSLNAYTIGAEAYELATSMRGDSGFVVLGQAERIVDAIIDRSYPEEKAFLFGRSQYISTYYKSLSYIAKKKGFVLKRMNVKKTPSVDAPYFFLSQSGKNRDSLRITEYELVGSEAFGRIEIYQLERNK